MDAEDFVEVRLSGPSRDSFLASAHELDMTPREYLLLVLNVADQLPKDLLLCLAAGIPVDFRASALVGDCGVCDA